MSATLGPPDSMILIGEPWTVVALIPSLRSVDMTEPETT
jgi:hypothetical protein